MCGIAGVIGVEGPQAREIVESMNMAMATRGPDDMGVWQEGQVCLGHRRLSIIDCSSAGHQPMLYRAGEGIHALTFNGEIYNFEELRQGLASAGVRFVSRSDTEVLLHLLLRGSVERAIEKLAGMFAFGYWNPRSRTMWIARDRLGIKPVYYHLSPDGMLTFASSLSAIVENPHISRRLNSEALEEFLTTGCPIAPHTMYAGIFELAAGHILEWRNGRVEVRCYWEIDWERQFSGSEAAAKEELSERLDQSVREHLVSDVPVGAFLSGGLDSSAVVVRAAKVATATFEAFTIRFPDSRYDESVVASDIARHVGVKHSIIDMQTMPVDTRFCRAVLQHVGQPFADSSCLPTFLVSQAASRKAKVVLSGDGGDELFAGYETFAWANKIHRIRSVPALLRRAAHFGLERMGSAGAYRDRIRGMSKGIRYSLAAREEMLLRLKCIFDPEEVARFSPAFAGQQPQLLRLREYLSRGSQYDHVTALTRWHMVFLVADMLRKVDCMSMAASIEVRVPLLDHRLVEFAHSLPVEYKVRGEVRKWLLRELMQQDLPGSAFTHPKQGFSVPLHRSMTDDFISDSFDLLLSSGAYARQLIKPKMLESLREATRRRAPLGNWSLYTTTHLFWMLVQLELWVRDNKVAA